MGDNASRARRRAFMGGALQGLGLVAGVVAAWTVGIGLGLAALAGALFLAGWAVERSA